MLVAFPLCLSSLEIELALETYVTFQLTLLNIEQTVFFPAAGLPLEVQHVYIWN